MAHRTHRSLAIARELAGLLPQVNAGSAQARDELFARSYSTLRQMARARLFGQRRHALVDTTVLVHEAYLRLHQDRRLSFRDWYAFLAYASKVMRSVIVDIARQRSSERAGGHLEEVELDTDLASSIPSKEHEILEVHDALVSLARRDARAALVVQMRYFGGFSEAEIALAMGVTERTVRRVWEQACGMLLGFLQR